MKKIQIPLATHITKKARNVKERRNMWMIQKEEKAGIRCEHKEACKGIAMRKIYEVTEKNVEVER